MNKKLLGVLIIICSILIFAGIIYVIFWNSDEAGEVSNNKITQDEPDKTDENEAQFSVKPIKQEIKTIIYKEVEPGTNDVSEADLKRIANSFAERFGSYSNQSNFSNVNDLKIFMSPRMQDWAKGYITEMRQNAAPGSLYYGITTKSIFQEVTKFDDDTGEARILVKTQRREATGAMGNASTFYQNIVISFIKVGEVWKVDSADWQKTENG